MCIILYKLERSIQTNIAFSTTMYWGKVGTKWRKYIKHACFCTSCIKHACFPVLVPTFPPHDIIAEKGPFKHSQYGNDNQDDEDDEQEGCYQGNGDDDGHRV